MKSDMIQNYLRSIHHERAREIKQTIKKIENKFHEISGIPTLQESDLTCALPRSFSYAPLPAIPSLPVIL